jgi:23S rRNA pseudouridine955/2504/2580 synthase
MQKFKINIDDESTRLDKWLKSHCHFTYGLIQKLFRKSDIKVNNKKSSPNYELKSGDIVTIYAEINRKPDVSMRQIDKNLYDALLSQIKSSIIFKDENIIAINKPYDTATQGGSGIKVSIDDVLDGLKFDYEIRPKLVHRLDRYTTGILLLARTKQMAELLTNYFRDGLIEKKYLAIVAGSLKDKAGIIKSKIAKAGSDDLKDAITKYNLLSSNKSLNISLVEFTPITGRTHQIRIHAAKDLNTPIIGDTKYGSKASLVKELTKKIHLHSFEMKIKNLLGKNYSIKAEIPDHMQLAIKKLEK